MSGRLWGGQPPSQAKQSNGSWMTRPAGQTKAGRRVAKIAVGLIAGVIALFVGIAMVSAGEKRQDIAQPTASASSPTATKAATPKVDKSELAQRLMAEVKVAADARTPWAMAVTGVECPDYCRVFYQENDLTREEIEAPARYLFLVTKPEELDVIVVQDASGRDHNVYRAKLLPAGR